MRYDLAAINKLVLSFPPSNLPVILCTNPPRTILSFTLYNKRATNLGVIKNTLAYHRITGGVIAQGIMACDRRCILVWGDLVIPNDLHTHFSRDYSNKDN